MGFPMTLTRVYARNNIDPDSMLADDIRRCKEDAVRLYREAAGHEAQAGEERLLREIADWDTERIAHLLSHPGELWDVQRQARAALASPEEGK